MNLMSDKSLKLVLDAFCDPTHVGHWYGILSVPEILILTLNWRKSAFDDNNMTILEELYRSDPEGKGLEALKVLEKTGSYDSFHGNFLQI